MKTRDWREAKVHEFWRFVAARHEVFIKRVIERQPPPWTADRALAGAHYTNVYRELDRVTRHLITRVLEPTESWPAEDRLFQVLLYRAFNLPETYEILEVNRALRPWNPKKAQAVLLARHATGMKVFTGAFLVNGLQQQGQATWSKPGGKIRLWVDRLTRIYYERRGIWEGLVEAEATRKHDARQGWQQAHKVLAALPGYGNFLAYEALVDLCYEPRVLRFSEDDWVNVGPGAKMGLAFLLAKRPAVWETPLFHLWGHQTAMQQQVGVRVRGPLLTLRNVEHVLCEYSKYRRMKLNIRPKRTYQLTRTNEDLSPWTTVSPKYWTLPQ